MKTLSSDYTSRVEADLRALIELIDMPDREASATRRLGDRALTALCK